ncbi:MAG: disulfide oxidoreductase [Acidimicrobiia bacterium]|nr:disulfide oxidoreductase [Acidimicrobiia bacterium]MDH4308366.1 disulfide oxidoreductase [Acidimicrobiia bacterium]MDH5294369.1 disulfide oxidoreductase [Acidimicrobiia bacterium]
MSVDVYNLIVSSLALLAIGVAILVIFVPSARQILPATRTAAAVALVATTGSLIYSEVFGFEPCRLCWYQRIAMYPLAVILVIAALRKDSSVKFYALPLAVIGGCISVYHYLLQTFPGLTGSTACAVGVPCTAKYVNQFGFVSIPFMAAAGFLLIIALISKETT